MNSVVFASKGGNTKKLAVAIAETIDVRAIPVADAGVLDAVDTLFIGASIYAGKIDAGLRRFLEGLSPQQVKKIVVFGTSAAKQTALAEVKEIAGAKGIVVSDQEFHCKGSFLFAHRGHPDSNDLKAAEAFAKASCEV